MTGRGCPCQRPGVTCLSHLAMLLLLGERGQSFSSLASVSPPGTQGQPTQPPREDFVALTCHCLCEAVLALGAGRPDILHRKRSAGDRAGPSGGLDLRWTRGSWLVTLGHSVLLLGLTHRRPPTSSRVWRCTQGGDTGKGGARGPQDVQDAGRGAGRCPAPALWALLLQPALTLSPQTRCPPGLGSPWRGQGSYTSGNVMPSPACEYFINGLKIEAELSAARGGWRRGTV